MTPVADETLVFVVRIWMERRERPETPAYWRGSVEDVASGERRYFTGMREMRVFMAEAAERLRARMDTPLSTVAEIGRPAQQKETS